MMTIETATITGAAHWASYLVNGDASGIEPREIELADAWRASNFPGANIIDIDVKRYDNGEAEESSFSWSYGWHTGDPNCNGGDVIDYVVTYQDDGE